MTRSSRTTPTSRAARSSLPAPARPSNLGLPAIVDANRDLEITAETNACLWDESRVDHGYIIDGLARADQLQ